MRRDLERVFRSLLEDHRKEPHHEDICKTCRNADAILRGAKPLRRSVKKARKEKTAKRATKKEKTATVRQAVVLRADNCCEWCSRPGTDFEALELDHFEGRARSETLESCWLLCRGCHRQKTNNAPSAAWWLEAFRMHCERNGYAAQARRAANRLESRRSIHFAAEAIASAGLAKGAE
jgi:5-methylcytosine-specific restriction endonuclease McrA